MNENLGLFLSDCSIFDHIKGCYVCRLISYLASSCKKLSCFPSLFHEKLLFGGLAFFEELVCRELQLHWRRPLRLQNVFHFESEQLLNCFLPMLFGKKFFSSKKGRANRHISHNFELQTKFLYAES